MVFCCGGGEGRETERIKEERKEERRETRLLCRRFVGTPRVRSGSYACFHICMFCIAAFTLIRPYS